MLGIFRKKTHQEVDVKDLMPYLEARFKKDVSSSDEKMGLIISDVRENIITLNKLLDELQAKKEAASKSFDSYSLSIKNKFCERALAIINEITYPEINYQDVKIFLINVSEHVKEISAINFKEFRHLHAFQDDLKKIASKLKEIDGKITVSKEIMKKMGIVASFDDIMDCVKKLEESSKKLSELKSEVENLKNELNEKEHTMKIKSGEFAAFLKIFEKLDGIKEERNRLEDELSLTKMKITTEFSGLDRLFKKLQHIDEKPDKMLEEYIKNPADTFLSDSDMHIKNIINRINEMLEKKIIEADEKQQKRLSELEFSIEYLTLLKNEIARLSNKINDIKEEIKYFDVKFAEKNEKEMEMENLSKQIKNMQNAIFSDAENIHETEKYIENIKDEIVSKVRAITKNEVEILF